MSRPIFEPDPEIKIAQNTSGINDTRNRVDATRWYQPDCASGTDCDGDEPTLANGSFSQPTASPFGQEIEKFAFRLNRDGHLQTKGVLDASGATSGDFAFTLPGPGDPMTEHNFIPFSNPLSPTDQSFSLNVSTTGDDSGVTAATGYVDSSTGDVYVRWTEPGSSTTAWMCVYDNLPYGQGINTSSSGDNLQFPYIDWSDNASGIFTYVRTASAIGAPNNYNPKLLVDGVYAFTAWEVSLSLGNAGKDFKLQYYLTGGWPGISNTFDFVEEWYASATKFSVAYPFFERTWVLPIKVGAGLTVTPSIRMIPESGASNFNTTLRNRLWITYLGPVEHSAAFATHNDPYPTTP